LTDGALLSLAANFQSLTDVAREALQEELARRRLSEQDVEELALQPKAPSRRPISGLLLPLKRHPLVVAIALCVIIRGWARFHPSANARMATFWGLSIFLLIVTGAILELRRIGKKERRRKRLAIAFGLNKKK
jgi:hypothetical protein